VEIDAAMYTPEERRLVSVRPGVTDLASIVFADEGGILAGSPDPDLLYNQIIRPWKSRLALLYIDHASPVTALRVIALTLVGAVSRPQALAGVDRMLADWGADPLLREVSRRAGPLPAFPPPGAAEVVSRYGPRAHSASTTTA
jgi:hypothetical protein